jgi:catechol 2,3-dioxygenase-like lactoylglutathione lyase family enzyme
MTIRGIHHVTLLVDNFDRAAWFYGEVLQLTEIPRYDFKFPGLFYICGDQELHLIVAAKPLKRERLFICPKDHEQISRNFIHRHVALLVSDWPRLHSRLNENEIRITFSPEMVEPADTFANNLIEGWRSRYGCVPTFCLDPFDNLLELIPDRLGSQIAESAGCPSIQAPVFNPPNANHGNS